MFDPQIFACSKELWLQANEFFYIFSGKKLSHLLADYLYCIFSSDSHPDLLVTQQHPHFFRSHWSSISTFTFWATTAISMQYQAIQCTTMQYHAIPCDTMQYHAIPCNIMQYHAIPCNTMQYHAIPCNTMRNHAIPCIINHCWGSVPLPCGQYKAIFSRSWIPWQEKYSSDMNHLLMIHNHVLSGVPKALCVEKENSRSWGWQPCQSSWGRGSIYATWVEYHKLCCATKLANFR